MRIPFGKIGKRGVFALMFSCLALFASTSAQAQTQRPSDPAMQMFLQGGTVLNQPHPTVQPNPNVAQPQQADPGLQMFQQGGSVLSSSQSHPQVVQPNPNAVQPNQANPGMPMFRAATKSTADFWRSHPNDALPPQAAPDARQGQSAGHPAAVNGQHSPRQSGQAGMTNK